MRLRSNSSPVALPMCTSRRGEFLFHEGDPANQFYLVRSGRVRLETLVPGRAPVVLETIQAGEVIGWSWLFPPYLWHFDAVATESVRATVFDGKCLRGKCEENHDLGYELAMRSAQIMMQRLQATRLQLLDVYGARRLNKSPLRPNEPMLPAPWRIEKVRKETADTFTLALAPSARRAAVHVSPPVSSTCFTSSASAKCRSRSAAIRWNRRR